MKKAVFLWSLLGMLFLGGLNATLAQDETADKKDSVSIDDADPVYYDAEEDEGSSGGSTGTILAIVGGVAVIAIGAFYFMKKKKG
jgi:LPXTG-motif cell wall-anchored protein